MINVINFRTGDLVQLKSKEGNTPNPFSFKYGDNVYQITSIETDRVRLSWESCAYNVEDLKPIPINGKDDIHIRLQVSKADPCVMDGMKISSEDKDFGYYLDRIKELGWDGLLDEIKQHKIKYVHQVQRYLDEHFANCHLKLDY